MGRGYSFLSLCYTPGGPHRCDSVAERFVFFQPVQVGDGDVEHEPQDHKEALKDEAVTNALPIVACPQAKHMKKR